LELVEKFRNLSLEVELNANHMSWGQLTITKRKDIRFVSICVLTWLRCAKI